MAVPSTGESDYTRGNAVVVDLDVPKEDDCQKAVATIKEREGKIDAVFHNAGHLYIGYSEVFTPEQMPDTFRSNAVLPAMRASTLTENDPMNMQQYSNPHAEGLVRIGRQAIAQEDDAALDAYFAPNFVFHGPAGDLSYEQLKAYFASLRAAFTGLKVERAAIIGDGDQLASRTVFSGRFEHVFTQAPTGPLAPNGAEVTWEVINIFQYDQQGRLVEEWVQTDYRSFLEKLGAAPSQTR